MKCIKCGKELEAIFIANPNEALVRVQPMIITQWKCNNVDCVIYNQPWSVNDHRDNQDWNVRHTQQLEARVQQLEIDNQTLKAELQEIKDAINDVQKT